MIKYIFPWNTAAKMILGIGIKSRCYFFEYIAFLHVIWYSNIGIGWIMDRVSQKG